MTDHIDPLGSAGVSGAAAPAEDPMPRQSEDEAWDALVRAVRLWGEKYLDQWDKFRFQTEYGMVYFSMNRSVPYPDSFEKLKK